MAIAKQGTQRNTAFPEDPWNWTVVLGGVRGKDLIEVAQQRLDADGMLPSAVCNGVKGGDVAAYAL